MKLHHFGFMLFACVLLAAGAFVTPEHRALTSFHGAAVNFRIDVYQDNVLVRTCFCWRYRQSSWGIEPYAEGDAEPSLEPIRYEWGGNTEIYGVTE
jgi:hypothetical protein